MADCQKIDYFSLMKHFGFIDVTWVLKAISQKSEHFATKYFLEHHSPIQYASFDTFGAKIGRLFTVVPPCWQLFVSSWKDSWNIRLNNTSKAFQEKFVTFSREF